MKSPNREIQEVLSKTKNLPITSVVLDEIAPSGNSISQNDLFRELLADKKPLLIDVRSEKEFARDPLPDALNFPILNDFERHEVGLLFNNQYQQTAVNLAHYYAQNKKENFFHRITQLLKVNDRPIYVYCWRGGGRSRYVTEILRREGFQIKRLEGGQKAYREIVSDYLYQGIAPKLLTLSGLTGVGKSQIIERIETLGPNLPTLHLERLAQHASSVFGRLRYPQPSIEGLNQNQFETRLFLKLQSQENKLLLSEHESPRIGNLYLPPSIQKGIQEELHIEVTCSIENRVKRIFKEYFGENPDKTAPIMKQKFQYIAKNMGLKRSSMILYLLDQCRYHEFIYELLIQYYDVRYRKPFKKPIAVVSSDDVTKAVDQVIQLYQSQVSSLQ